MPFPTEPKTFSHGLADRGLASDEALAALLDRYPEDLFDINIYSFDDRGQFSLTTGSRGKADGATLLREIKAGRVWVNLRDIELNHPDLWGPAFEALEALTGEMGVRPVKATGQMILSAPAARVPYHFDAAAVVLFHLRGRKRIYIYPTDEAHLPQTGMEKTIMRTTTEELPYDLTMDANACRLDLQAGEAVTWPLYAPHRVENLGEFNVSLSVDFQTWGSRMTRGAHFANGVLRRWGLTPAAMASTPMAARAALWACSLAMKQANLAENRIRDFERSFQLGDADRAAV
ncbi:MAG: transcriptional regulator [Caulobacter sp.]|nr:transcriptional regulator [Caulobacter sp.]